MDYSIKLNRAIELRQYKKKAVTMFILYGIPFAHPKINRK